MKPFVLLILSAALCALPSLAAAQVDPRAVDPIFTLPFASLTPQQIATLQKQGSDWPQLARFRDDNARLAPPAPGQQRVVFFGDSITDAWGRYLAAAPFFPGKPYVNRGISGQTTAQMLVRFHQDVVALHPAAVVILAGTNDIAGNTGLTSLRMTEDNFESMAEIAAQNHIRLILASVLPTTAYPWRPGVQPAATVRELNQWLKTYAQAHGDVYLDYYSAMSNVQGGLDPALAKDGVHPTVAGYAIMGPLAEKAIHQALGQ